MTDGPGKYDALATHVREATGAEGVVIMVVGGNQGNGFAVQAPLSLLLDLPRALHIVADGIAADLAEGRPPP